MSFLRYCSSRYDYEFILSLDCFAKMSKNAISCCPKETGGVFIGFYDNSFHSAKVTQLLFNKNNKGLFARFSREGNNLTKSLAKIWEKSRGKEYYIGEWHSHPNSYASPSNVDNNTMISIAKTPEEECKTPILGILGNKMNDFRKDMCLFVYPNGEKIVKLDFIEVLEG